MTDPLQPCINELLRLNALLLTQKDDKLAFFRTLTEIERLCNYHKSKLSTRTVIDDATDDDELTGHVDERFK